MKIYLTRHGQTEWNLEGRLQGRLNSNLTSLGVEQAKWLGERLKETSIDVICSSPSQRALDTAYHIRGDRHIDIETYDDLMEIYLGKWQGMKHDDVTGHFEEDSHNFWHKPQHFVAKDQESFEDVIKRGERSLLEIVSKHHGKDVLIVSHGVLLKGIMAYIKGLEIESFWSGPFMKSTCLTIVNVTQDAFLLELEGDISHYIV